jgi:hypothetical protein
LFFRARYDALSTHGAGRIDMISFAFSVSSLSPRRRLAEPEAGPEKPTTRRDETENNNPLAGEKGLSPFLTFLSFCDDYFRGWHRVFQDDPGAIAIIPRRLFRCPRHAVYRGDIAPFGKFHGKSAPFGFCSPPFAEGEPPVL